MGQREVALRPPGDEAVGGKFVFAKRPREKAALVGTPFQVDEPDAGQGGNGREFQTTLTSGIGTMNRPPRAR